MALGWILALTFFFMVFFVGGYVVLMLNVMRADPREQKFRTDQNESTKRIVPKQRSVSKR